MILGKGQFFGEEECLKMIGDVEAQRSGTSGYKALNMNEKYKIAIMYMKMLENPKRFANLERLLPQKDQQADEEGKVLLRLPQEDIEEYKKIQEKKKKGKEKEEAYGNWRKKTMERSRARSVLPEK